MVIENLESTDMKLFESNIISIHGDAGRKWLTDLPHMVENFAVAWRLSGLKPVDNLSYNYVLSGFRERQPVILKLGLDIKDLNTEAAALNAFNGHGAVEVLDQTPGALLLERATPGHSLKRFFPNLDDEAIVIASEVIRKLHRIPKINLQGFPTINDWLTSLDTNYEILGHYLPKARTLRNELLSTMNNPILLHGDLHHDNILAHGNEWKIIDPKGVMGELAYEVGCFIRNPIEAGCFIRHPTSQLLNSSNALPIIKNRIDGFAKYLNLDPDRILKWCFVQAVLAIVWTVEDNIDSTNFMHLTKIFDTLMVQ
jgi:streptomycin 6-kinase